ncbi:hypothetical protein [Pantoea agglomerans]|uniref:hypothetical protein n=1 Tax=Enterobacter agglomerans TaxID=549 RepID=UPI00057F5E12|nr:hypothetical protein [Pantoea agglomerans]KIC86369.1 hypothetical protein RN49_14015 [Pantoea agglomerans]
MPNGKQRLFKSFDSHDIYNFLDNVSHPQIKFIVEDEPSTAYNQVAFVLESKKNDEWFYFQTGRFAAEGDEGYRLLNELRDFLIEKEIPISCWVLSKHLVVELDNGYTVWPSIKHHAIPVRAFNSDKYFWKKLSNLLQSPKQEKGN